MLLDKVKVLKRFEQELDEYLLPETMNLLFTIRKEIESGCFDTPITEEGQKNRHEQHSSLTDSRMMTISKFAWDEKIEEVRKLREGNNHLAETLWIKDELQKLLIEERDTYKKHADDFEQMYLQEHREKNRLKRDRDKLVKELEWYASFWNHDVQLEDIGVTPIQRDKGDRARTILSEIKGTTQEDKTNG